MGKENNNTKTKICNKCGRELPMTIEYYAVRRENRDGFRGTCRECDGKQFLTKDKKEIKVDDKKKCKQCGEYKYINDDNFSPSVRNRDGFLNICKACQIKNRHIESKEGYKTCKKCKRELPLDRDHFHKDRLCLDGYRNICYECQGRKFYPNSKSNWTQDEINILKEYYPYMSNEELFERYFKTHTIQSMRDYATKILKLQKDEKYLSERSWTEEEDQFLIENYAFTDTKELSEIFNKTEDTVRARAIKYELKKDLWWTDEDIELLIENYPCMKNIDLQQKYFPHKNYSSITDKAVDLGLKKDEEYLYNMRCETIRKNGMKLYKYVKKGDKILKVYTLKGENNPRYKQRIKLNCAYCGKEIYRLKSNVVNNLNTFCSRHCSAQWKSENMSGKNSPLYGVTSDYWSKDENKRKQAEKMIKRLQESDFSYRKTKPQLIIDNILQELDIKYENEYSCKYYLIDNYLVDFNLMIEVQGNFFHCNPTMNLENSRKVKIIGKDKSKHTYVSRYYDIEILYLWEKDVYERKDVCTKLILEYIRKQGKLEDYHSFNYHIDKNGELTLLDEKYVIGY